MQHFHTHDTLRELLLQYFENVEIRGSQHESQIYAIASIPREQPREKVVDAINTEFNMEYPGNYRHNMHSPLVDVILSLLESERNFANVS